MTSTCSECLIVVCSICHKCHQGKCTARTEYCGTVRLHYQSQNYLKLPGVDQNISSVTIQDYLETIKALKRLVRDYDTYLQDIMPLAYAHYKKPAQLREQAREEGIDIKEPGELF